MTRTPSGVHSSRRDDSVAVVLYSDAALSRRAVGLLEQHAASDGLRVADAVIPAAALGAGFGLAAGNVRHDRAIAGLELISFRP